MVRKFVLMKTNKESISDEYPAFVVHFTDFSPNRKDALAREVLISNSAEQIETLYHSLKEANVKKGWTQHSGVIVAPAPELPSDALEKNAIQSDAIQSDATQIDAVQSDPVKDAAVPASKPKRAARKKKEIEPETSSESATVTSPVTPSEEAAPKKKRESRKKAE